MPVDALSTHKSLIGWNSQRFLAAVGLSILGLALLAHVYRLVELSTWAIRYPHGLDYVEGLLWEHMRLFDAGRAYAPVKGFPAIAFPYPPVYYLVVDATAWLTDLDGLAAGRIVSIVSLLATGIAGGAIVHRIAVTSTPGRSGTIPAVGAGLVLLSTLPVLMWVPLMRVDMLALCFTLTGVYFAMVALDRPRFILIASTLFLLAVFTKQTLVAAPAASFLVLLFLRPKTAFIGILFCLITGSAILAWLQWATNGSAIHHLFAMNVSRVVPSQLKSIVSLIATHSIYVGVAAFSLRGRISLILAHWRGTKALAGFRARMLADRGSAMSLILIVYLVIATPMLLTVMKAGAYINYLLEWTNIIALFCGLSLTGAARTLGPSTSATGLAKGTSALMVTIAALSLQALLLPSSRTDIVNKLPDEAELRSLSMMVREAGKPIISDDMVILVRNGKEVYIEPALIGEGSKMGTFAQRPLLEDILASKFAFFITDGARGDPLFQSRYSVEAADAIDMAYPRKLELAGRTIHLPAK